MHQPEPAATTLPFTGESGARLDLFVARALPHLSRTRVQSLVEQGYIQVNERRAKASTRLEPGDSVIVREPIPEPLPVLPESASLPLDIVFEDQQLLVINKPAGLVVHPAAGHERDTLVDALLAHHIPLGAAPEDDDARRPGIVHRLDKDTSGLLLVAKTPEAMLGLTQQFQAHTITKRYLALVEGHLPVPEGAIDAPVGRDQRQRQRMAITAQHGRDAQTLFWVEQEFSRFTLLRVQIITGRTHQIRVHFAAIGHPVAGDSLYGRTQRPAPPRLFLHAAELRFTHPTSGQELSFSAPLPPDLQGFLATLA